jgi:DNA-binding CsgD family transcriptional regulator/tetratricopeptide (TPR) repeat protein
VFEELANSAYGVGRLEDAFLAMQKAIVVFGELGDAAAVGRCTRVLSRFHWYAGDGETAREKAREAITILEPLGESVELARAYSGLSQLAMLAENIEQTLLWGEQALELARRLGDAGTQAHALSNIGAAKIQMDHRDTATLLEAHAIADAAGDRHEATRALTNLAYSLMTWVRPGESRQYAERALAYAEEHEVHTLAPYLSTVIAWLQLRAGEWDEAERRAGREIEGDVSVAQLLAKTVLTELAVRRGDPDAAPRLADLAEQADRTGELQRISPVLELEIESALTSGARISTDRIADAVDDVRIRGRLAIRVAAWAVVAGLDVELDEPATTPHAAMLRRDWKGAADAFGDVGWTYDRALMLSLLDDEESLSEAIEIARGLGAEPLTRRVALRMRELRMSVPQGPRESTRANPAGLTARQLEVLSLLAAGLTNAEIADRLVVSPRTAEHHVAAVLTKLGAATRRDAARRAAELGLAARE